MTDSNYINVYTGNFIFSQQILRELENIGINAIIKDETESGRLAGFGSSIAGQQEIYVHKDELDKAKTIVDTVTSQLSC